MIYRDAQHLSDFGVGLAAPPHPPHHAPHSRHGWGGGGTRYIDLSPATYFTLPSDLSETDLVRLLELAKARGLFVAAHGSGLGGIGALDATPQLALIRQAADHGRIAEARTLLRDLSSRIDLNVQTPEGRMNLDAFGATSAYIDSKADTFAPARVAMAEQAENALVAENARRVASGEDAREIASQLAALRLAKASPTLYGAFLDGVPGYETVDDLIAHGLASGIGKVAVGIVVGTVAAGTAYAIYRVWRATRRRR